MQHRIAQPAAVLRVEEKKAAAASADQLAASRTAGSAGKFIEIVDVR